MRRLLRKWLWIVTVVMLLGLTLQLVACGTPLIGPCAPLPSISKPVPDRSPPSETYSAQWSKLVDESQKKVMSGLPKP
jgi:hypothetical protein